MYFITIVLSIGLCKFLEYWTDFYEKALKMWLTKKVIIGTKYVVIGTKS